MLSCPEIKSALGTHNRSFLEFQLAIRLERRLQCQMLRSIRVHICGDELQLFGQVDSWYEKQQAQEAARLVAPMYLIRNELRVQQDERAAPMKAQTSQNVSTTGCASGYRGQ